MADDSGTATRTGVDALPAASRRSTGQRRQLRDEVAAYVREMISAGKVRPGVLLRLAPLAEALDMSATPVREGLLLLVQEGWVTQEPNRGFRVTLPRRKDVLDSYLMLAFLSGELASRTATLASDQLIARLRRLDATVAALDPSEGETAQAINGEIHQVIAAGADSPRLSSFVSLTTRFVPRRFWHIIPGWFDLNRVDHAAVIEAIAEHAPGAAKAAMNAHIERAGKLLVDYLDTTNFWEQSEDPDASIVFPAIEAGPDIGSVDAA